MSKQEIIKIFGDRKIRSVWDDEAETWYFSIVDVVAVLTEILRNLYEGQEVTELDMEQQTGSK